MIQIFDTFQAIVCWTSYYISDKLKSGNYDYFFFFFFYNSIHDANSLGPFSSELAPYNFSELFVREAQHIYRKIDTM